MAFINQIFQGKYILIYSKNHLLLFLTEKHLKALQALAQSPLRGVNPKEGNYSHSLMEEQGASNT